jgi:hypothetical protein
MSVSPRPHQPKRGSTFDSGHLFAIMTDALPLTAAFLETTFAVDVDLYKWDPYLISD